MLRKSNLRDCSRLLVCVMGLLASTAACAAASDNQLNAAERDAGWQLLFDGQSLAGWRTYRATAPGQQWQVQDGALTLTGKGGGDLIYDQRYQNFELQLQWRISRAGNSGVFILADEELDYIFVKAPEVQLLDDARHPDNKVATHLSGSLYDLIASPDAARRPAEEWNSLRIRYLDQRLRVWQNGVATADIVIGSQRWNDLVANSKFAQWPFATLSEGYIGLQDHGDPVAFKNIKLLPLKPERATASGSK